MSTDEAKKQYFILAIIVAIIVSIFLNFTVIGSIPGPFVSGFPFNAYEVTGAGLFGIRIINSLILGGLLAVPTYYFLNWLLLKSGGGY